MPSKPPFRQCHKPRPSSAREHLGYDTLQYAFRVDSRWLPPTGSSVFYSSFDSPNLPRRDYTYFAIAAACSLLTSRSPLSTVTLVLCLKPSWSHMCATSYIASNVNLRVRSGWPDHLGLLVRVEHDFYRKLLLMKIYLHLKAKKHAYSTPLLQCRQDHPAGSAFG